jgi:hypothetical protein
MKSHAITICCLAAFILFALPVDMRAGENTLTPQLFIGGRYDNNVLFERTNPIDDYSSVVRPALEFNHKTERSNLDIGADMHFVNYLDRSDMDTVKQYYYMNGDTQLSERIRVDAEMGYIIDTLLDSELEETGRVFNREERERLHAGAGMDYSLSEKFEIGLDYDFNLTDYEEEERADRKTHSVSTYFRRFFNEGIDSLTVLPKYRYIVTTDDIEVNSFSLSLGWTHKSSEIGALKLFAGGRYTEESPTSDNTDPDAQKRDTSGFIFDLSYNISDEISSFLIGIRRDINFDADGDLREVNRLYSTYQYSLTERLKSGISANAYLTRSEDENVDTDIRYFNIRPRLDYSLTEKHILRLSYRYSLEYDDTKENKTVDRSQIELSVIFRFPNKF